MQAIGERHTDALYDVCDTAIKTMCDAFKQEEADILNYFQQNIATGNQGGWGVAFTSFSISFFHLVTRQLHKSFTAYAAFKGNSDYLDSLKIRAKVFFNDSIENQTYCPSEYLVDFYAALHNEKLAPLVTMESEAKLLYFDNESSPSVADSATSDTSLSQDALHDLDKLLSVSSPRRIYVGHIGEKHVTGALRKIQERLDAAYRSQILMRGDEFVLVLFVKSGDKYRVSLSEFDASARMVDHRSVAN